MTSSGSGTRSRGRAKVDIASRLRVWGWYWHIKELSGMSDDALDEKYIHVNEDVRPRLFFQIRTMGSSPIERRGYRERKSLYERVHSDGAYSRAKEWYESGLWDMLCTPKPERSVYPAFMKRAMVRNNWYRAPPDALDIGGQIFGEEEVAFSGIKGDAYQAALNYFVSAQHLDDVAMLAALFREAHEELDIELAIRLRDALEVAQDEYCKRYKLPPIVSTLLDRLIMDRIIGNTWIAEEDVPKQAVNDEKTRKGRLKAFVRWYVQSGAFLKNTSRARHPIVPSNPRLEWLEGNRHKIAPPLQHLADSYRAGMLSSDHYAELKAGFCKDVKNRSAKSLAKRQDGPRVLPGRGEYTAPPDMLNHRRQRAKRANHFDHPPLKPPP